MILIRVYVQRNHRPLLHGGVVMKINDNQRYATTSVTQAVLREVAATAGVPVQRVCVRNDSACGSTIGPLLSTRLAMRTVDVGMPQWAMHSIREVCCTSSIAQATALYAVCSGCTWVHAHGAHEHFRPSTSTVRACLHRLTSSDKSVVCVCGLHNMLVVIIAAGIYHHAFKLFSGSNVLGLSFSFSS
jgi:hypothetical protein